MKSFAGDAAQVSAFVLPDIWQRQRCETFPEQEERVVDPVKDRIRTVSKPFGLEGLGMSAERKQMPQVVEIPRNSGKG
jgi:hypothetical protein